MASSSSTINVGVGGNLPALGLVNSIGEDNVAIAGDQNGATGGGQGSSLILGGGGVVQIVNPEKLQTDKNDSGLMDDDDEEEVEEDGAFSVFGLKACPECGKNECFRPVQEWCGHFKCRKCYIASEEDCAQCLDDAMDHAVRMGMSASNGKNDLVSKEKEGQSQVAGRDPLGDNDNLDETAKYTQKIILKEDESLFEFELNGKITYAVMNEETLRKLGLQPQTQTEGEKEPDIPMEDSVVGGDKEGTKEIESPEAVVDAEENSEVNANADCEKSEVVNSEKSEDVNCETSEVDSTNCEESEDVNYENSEIDHGEKSEVDCESSEVVNGEQSEVDISEEVVYAVKSEANYNEAEEVCDNHNENEDDDAANQGADYIPPTTRSSSSASVKKEVKPKRRDCIRLKKNLSSSHIIQRAGASLTMAQYKCTICREKFNEKYKHKYHVFCDPANGPRPFICQYCNKEFTSRSHYDYHVRLHTGERPFKCTICTSTFIQKVKLNRHMRSHSRNTSSGENQARAKAKTRSSLSSQRQNQDQFKPYICAVCKRRFMTVTSAKRHVANHTNDTPFDCSVCHKKFKQKYALDVHAKVHDVNSRTHKCSECPKAFTTAKDLRRHFLIHTGEHPFECSMCKAQFKRKDNFERHIRSTHKLEESVIKFMSKQQLEKYYKSKNPDAQPDEEMIIDGIMQSIGM